VKRTEGFFLFFILLLFSVGVTMVFDTTSADVIDAASTMRTDYALLRQLLFALIGVLLAGGVFLIGHDLFLRMSGKLLLFFSLLLVLVFVPGIGQKVNGANRWIRILGASLQPSEFVRVILPAFFIYEVGHIGGIDRFSSFCKIMAKMALPMGLILIEPDNGTVAILLATLVALFFLMRINAKFWALPLTLLVLAGGAAASQMPHVSDRIQIYLHPELDLRGKGHQPYQAKIAAGSGGIWGKGLGESLQKMHYLPEAHNDYIAAIFAEEFGFVGMALLALLYSAIAFLGYRLALSAPSYEGAILTAILTFLIVLQAFLNLGVVSGLLPSKGTNLPFFSQGGSSLWANLLAVSLILSAQRSPSGTLAITPHK